MILPVLEMGKIYDRREDQEEYALTLREVEKWKEIPEALETLMEHLRFPSAHAIPDWIRKWAEELEKDGVTLEEALEEARRIGRKFKVSLSEEIIAEREERR